MRRLLLTTLLALTACAGPQGEPGPAGADSCALCHMASNDNGDRVSQFEGQVVQAPSVSR